MKNSQMKLTLGGGSSMVGQSRGTAGPQKKKSRVEPMYRWWIWCHQCHNKKDKGIALECRKCRKSYCVNCAHKWYPTIDDESFRESCPLCHNICNCGDCLKDAYPYQYWYFSRLGPIRVQIKEMYAPEDVFYFSTYTISALLPSLEKFVAENSGHQASELLDRARDVLPGVDYGIPVLKGPWPCSCPADGRSSKDDSPRHDTLEASSREPGDDNQLYYPLGSDKHILDVEHFQFHFSRGQPVIIQNV